MADRVVALSDRLSRRFARQLATVLRALERRIRTLARDDSGRVSRDVQVAQAARVRRDVQSALTESGYADLARAATTTGLDQVAVAVLQSRAARGAAQLAGNTGVRLVALQELHLDDLLGQGEQLTRALTQAVMRSVLVGEPVDVAALGRVVDTTEARVATLYDTAVSIYARQVEATQADPSPETQFRYVGPSDAKTRPFCVTHLDRIYTRAEIADLNNGQLDNVFLTGGGYNCRHVWHEVPRALAVAS